MTLALYGKSRRRQWMLVALALFALIGAMSAAVAIRSSAGATVASALTLPLHNDSAEVGTDCPADGKAYWHFVINPNNNKSEFVEFDLNLGDGMHNISSFVLNGTQKDNVFVEVPSGYQLSSLVKTGSTADILWDGSNPEPGKFVLSHTCPGAPDPSIDIKKSNDTGDNVVLPGEQFNWIIKVTVSGAETDAATSITDTIPSDFTAGTYTLSSGQLSCDPTSGNSVSCTLASGAPVGEYTITVPVKAAAEHTCGTPITNTAYAQMGDEDQKRADDPVTISCDQTTRELRVCKVVETESATGGVFTIKVEGEDDFVTTNLVPLGDNQDCTTYDVADGAEVTITETGFPAGWVSAEFYPTVSANVANFPGNTITVTVGAGTCGVAGEQTTGGAPDCTVVFYNKSDGQTESKGLILVEKYIEIDGNLATALPGEGPVAGWTVTVDGETKQTTLPATVTFEATVGDTVPVSETTQAGYVVLGHTINGGSLAGGSSTNVQVTEGTTLVRFYNQPLGSLTVNKVALTSHNNSPDVPSPQDRDGWLITVQSATCKYSDTGPTDANGNVSFMNLPKCTDYVVSENTSNPQSPNFVPVGASSVSNVTPNGQTITFTNRRTTIEFRLVTPTPTFTPVNTPTPTNTPVNTPTPTNTPEPEPTELTLGERTPGPTPIAPSTGDGGASGAGGVNLLLILAAMAALTGGTTLVALGRKTRR